MGQLNKTPTLQNLDLDTTHLLVEVVEDVFDGKG